MTDRSWGVYVHRIFMDSSAYLALVSLYDTFHQEARAYLTYLTDHRWRTFTTNFVVAETHALFIARLGSQDATAFLRQMEQTATTVIRVSLRDERRAREIVYRYTDKSFSFTDALSFAVMERLHIREAFTFDGHFRQFGFASGGPSR